MKRGTVAEEMPDLLGEWDYSKNTKVGPYDVSSASHKKVWWLCSVCSHSWCAKVGNRVLLSHGCPACSCKIVSDKNRLTILRPDIASEWDCKNNGLLKANNVSVSSNKHVWWKCSNNHSWIATVCSRTSEVTHSGCPYCSGYYVSDSNRLSTCYPEVVKEWHPTKNGSITPDNISYASHYRAWWLCSKGHETRSFVNNRAYHGHKCPVCANTNTSSASQEWLDSVGIPNKHSITREVTIKFDGGYYKVDGFDPDTNTVYEFLGDYWHGNPKTFPREGINSHNGKTFGFLFDKTEVKLSKLRLLGYNVVSMWESVFERGK